MKLTNTLLLAPLMATGLEAQHEYPGILEISPNVTNHAVSPGNTRNVTLFTREEAAYWENAENDQERCAYADRTNTIGSRVIRKRSCQRLVDHFTTHRGFWGITGWHWGDDVWAALAYSGSCEFSVARVDGRDDDFQ